MLPRRSSNVCIFTADFVDQMRIPTKAATYSNLIGARSGIDRDHVVRPR
jgi:hypothetical protein